MHRAHCAVIFAIAQLSCWFRLPNAHSLLLKIACDNAKWLPCCHPWSRSRHGSSAHGGKVAIYWTSGPTLVAMATKAGLGAEIQTYPACLKMSLCETFLSYRVLLQHEHSHIKDWAILVCKTVLLSSGKFWAKINVNIHVILQNSSVTSVTLPDNVRDVTFLWRHSSSSSSSMTKLYTAGGRR